MRVPEFTIIKPLEQWSNGYFVTEFEYAGVDFKLMQSEVRHADDEEHTYLHVEWSNVGPRSRDRFAPENHWIAHKYNWTFHGIVSVECAVQFLAAARDFYATGREHGDEDARSEIRKVIGIK